MKRIEEGYVPLCVVLDSASATSVLIFLVLPSSGLDVVSILSCLILGLTSSPSSKLLEVRGLEEALLLGVELAAPSTHKSPGAGSLGLAGGGVCTLVEPGPFLPLIGADIEGRRELTTDKGGPLSSDESLSSGFDPGKHPKFSLLHDTILCWMKRTISDRAKGFWQEPQVRMSWWPVSVSPPSESAETRG